MPKKKWESGGAAAYYWLGLSFYVYEWLIALGISGSVIATFFFRHQVFYLVAVYIVSTVLFFSGITAWIVRAKKRLQFLNPDFAIVSMIDTYERNGQEYTFERNLALRALRTGVDAYRFKYRWTGSGAVEMSVEPAAEWTTTVNNNNELWDMLHVRAATPFHKTEERSVTIRFQMIDPADKALPYMTQFVDDFYPNGFTERVRLGAPPARVKREIFLTPRGEIPAYQEYPRGPHKSEISWRVKKPMLERRYKLSWR